MKNNYKKLIFFVFCLVIVFCLFSFTGCDNGLKYTVSYYNDGSLVKTEKVIAGKSAKGISVSNPNGYSLIGWEYDNKYYDLNSEVYSDITLNAVFSGYEVEIIFKNANGNVLNKKNTLYSAGDIIEAPSNPTMPSDDDYDYEFSGWDVSFGIAQKDMTITAQYSKTVRQYKVIYYSYDNETIYLTNMVDKGGKAPNTTLTRDKDSMYTYTFYKWCLEDGSDFDFETPITKNTYLYPTFKTKARSGFDFSKAVVSMLGDSVSTYYASNSSVNSYYSGHNEFYYPIYSGSVLKVEQTWWYQAIESLGATLGINNSLSGSCVYGGDNATQSDKRINTLNENGEPNIIFCMISANDNVNGYSVSQVKTAYNTMLTKLHKRYPNAYVFCITWGYVGYTGYNYTEEDRLAYNQAIRDLCDKDYATVIDWATVQTKDTYSAWLGDAMHFNTVGMTELGKYVSDCVKAYFADTED